MTLLLDAFVLALVYWFPLRRWFSAWGSAPEDRDRAMPGDAAVTDPVHAATLAVTITAPPDHVWPWLAQSGYRRGGLYSYDWLDRLFGYRDGPSASRILSEYQGLKAGDVIPMGRGPGFPVTLVDAPRGPGPWLFMRVIEPAAFLMTRRMLLGIKQRAEELAREAGVTSV